MFRLLLEDCEEPDRSCFERVCEADLPPEAKQLLLESLLYRIGVVPLPRERRAKRVECGVDQYGRVWIDAVGDDGMVYRLVCFIHKGRMYCAPGGCREGAEGEADLGGGEGGLEDALEED